MTYKELQNALKKHHYNERDAVHKLYMKWVKANALYEVGDKIKDKSKAIKIEVVSYTFSNVPDMETVQIIYIGGLIKDSLKIDNKPSWADNQILQIHAKPFKKKKKNKKK